jgi:hypothetical protein
MSCCKHNYWIWKQVPSGKNGVGWNLQDPNNDGIMFRTSTKYTCKGKEIPLQAWTGSEGSRRLRLQDFKTIDT